jgi:hypothetical protein
MFENKIEELDRQLLLGHLSVLWSYGWRSVLLSEQLSTFITNSVFKAINESSETSQETRNEIFGSPY